MVQVNYKIKTKDVNVVNQSYFRCADSVTCGDQRVFTEKLTLHK